MESAYTKAWKNFQETINYKTLLALTTIEGDEDGEKYARNRLKAAFDAGWLAHKKFLMDIL